MIADEGAIGKAGIFGGNINPLQLFIQNQAGRERAAEAQRQQAIKQRDEVIKDYMKFNPEKVWEPFYEEVNRAVQTKVRDFASNALMSGVSPSALIPKLEKEKGDINTLVNKINWVKSVYTDMNKRIDEDDYLKPDYYKSKLNDYIFNGMQAKPYQEINLDGVEGMFNDPRGYNIDKIITDFMKELPTKINTHYSEYWDKLGQKYDIQETGTKLGFEYVTGPDGQKKVVIDTRTGTPKINMTDDVYTQALGNEYLMNIVSASLGTDATDQQKKAFLTELLKGRDPMTIKEQPRVGHKYGSGDTRFYFGGSGFQTNPDDLEARDQVLTRIVTGNNDALSYLNDLNSDVSAKLSPDKKKLIFSFPSYVGVAPKTQEEINAMTPGEQNSYYELLSKSKIIKDKTFDISTEAGRRDAKIAMSQRMDELDKKRAIGMEYVRYVDEKRKQAAKKSNKGAGASGVKWK